MAGGLPGGALVASRSSMRPARSRAWARTPAVWHRPDRPRPQQRVPRACERTTHGPHECPHAHRSACQGGARALFPTRSIRPRPHLRRVARASHAILGLLGACPHVSLSQRVQNTWFTRKDREKKGWGKEEILAAAQHMMQQKHAAAFGVGPRSPTRTS